jgi:glycosyltransferase involved in cell wall biosynthesis
MAQKANNLSFIIPAYNEELLISETINSIIKYVPESYSYEIVVVDHDSTDKTAHIASSLGAQVIPKSGGSIASARNSGSSVANGDILIFLDADVLLTDAWTRNINQAVEQICKNERILTGSWVSIPDRASWIERHWYKPLQHGDNTHINTGHLIIARNYFYEIGGFAEHLETGEDYEFSMRVSASGGIVLDNNELVVIHKGYPTNLYEFIRREFWHGKGDTKSISDILRSKVAILSLLFLLLHIILATSMSSGKWYISELSVGFILIIVAASSVVKYKHAPALSILISCILYYFYFWSRSLSMIVFFRSGKVTKHHR